MSGLRVLVAGCGAAVLLAFAALQVAQARVCSAASEPRMIKAKFFLYPFQNFDYDENKCVRDNPVTIIFVSNRSNMVRHVYGELGLASLTGNGSDDIHLRGIGGSRRGVRTTDPWKSNSAGVKGAFGCWGLCPKTTNIHIRTYGPDGREGTQVYQNGFGLRPYYLIATTHLDRDEHGPARGFGWQSRARSLLVAKMTSLRLWRVIGSTAVANACNSSRVEGRATYVCQSDGKATIISIDG